MSMRCCTCTHNTANEGSYILNYLLICMIVQRKANKRLGILHMIIKKTIRNHQYKEKDCTTKKNVQFTVSLNTIASIIDIALQAIYISVVFRKQTYY